MQIGTKHLLVVGDRVLIRPESPEQRTKVGLVLPQTVVQGQPVQWGRIVETGPGVAIPNLAHDTTEPWQREGTPPVKYVPLQAEIGDLALFLRKEAFEVRYDSEDFLIVPHNALLMLVRDEGLPGDETAPLD